MLTAITCPHDDAPLRLLNRHTAACPNCDTEWLITLTDAYCPGKRNYRAPAAGLIDLIMAADGYNPPPRPRQRRTGDVA